MVVKRIWWEKTANSKDVQTPWAQRDAKARLATDKEKQAADAALKAKVAAVKEQVIAESGDLAALEADFNSATAAAAAAGTATSTATATAATHAGE